ncbi:galactose-binding domain-like protein [Aspergillus karnatakaensis]|uniref:anaphase promoting complex subunit DOC1 n=1 Tax=Aspergillus karnatakaensis TaxID=1810916 RepID=UPI003CCD91D7
MPRHVLRRHPTAPPPEPPPSDSPQPPPPRQRLNHIPAQPQFQTPSPRGPSIPQLHPSSRPIEPSVDGAGPSEPVRRAAAAQAALFSLFGRGVVGRPQGRESIIGEGSDNNEDDSQLDDVEGDEHDEDLDDAEIDGQVGVDEEGSEVELSEEEMEGMVGEAIEDGDIEEDEDEMMQDRDKSPTPLPSDLREISSLASWTVSTHKPGCGVAALRNPDHTQYWQSDGPQPHTLTLHFFKLVPVVKIRVYLDFSLDESYTPTKMTFLAGMGGNDLVEFATWEGEGPCGWVDVPLEGVGGQNGGWVRKTHRRRRAQKSSRPRGQVNKAKEKSSGGIFVDDSLLSDSENFEKTNRKHSHGHKPRVHEDQDEPSDEGDWGDDGDDDDDDPYAGSVLKAMVIQMRVMENHQNGKDTHVRGFQVFARDDDRRRVGNAPSASADGRVRRHSIRKSLRGATDDDGRGEGNGDRDRGKDTELEEPDWMGDPVIR